MTPWMIALTVYFAVGLALVFVGPAARLLYRERVKLALRAYDQPRWKLLVFSAAIALGIILLWPILAVSAARAESAAEIDISVRHDIESGIDFSVRQDVKASEELDRRIAEIQNQYSKHLPFEAYQEIEKKLPWTDRVHFDDRLAQLDYAITGFATGPEGQDFAVAVPVLKIGTPFALTTLRGRDDLLPATCRLAENEVSLDPLHHGPSFRLPAKPDDEVWGFSTSPDSWQQLAGRSGLALVREGVIIDAYVTMMN